MPSLDVSFMTTDLMLCDKFTVQRRADIVGDDGRTTPTITATFPNQIGIVTQESPSDLMRNPDFQMAPRQIFIASKFQFKGVSAGNQPDHIIWNGCTYTVKSVLPYSRYGHGVYEVIAESMNATDADQ